MPVGSSLSNSNNSISNASENVNKDYTDILQEDALKQYNKDKADISCQARKNINNSDYTKIDLSTLDSKKLKMYNSRGWANALFTKEDIKLLNEKFGELDNRINSKTDNMLGDGSRVIEVNNKLVVIGGTFEEPEIYCVIAINADNETEATDLKEVVFYEYKNYRRNKETLQYLFQYVQSCEKDVRTYRAEDFYYTKGQKDYGERAVLPSNFKNYGYTGEKQNRAGSNPKTGQGISDEQLKDNIKFSRRYSEYYRCLQVGKL